MNESLSLSLREINRCGVVPMAADLALFYRLPTVNPVLLESPRFSYTAAMVQLHHNQTIQVEALLPTASPFIDMEGINVRTGPGTVDWVAISGIRSTESEHRGPESKTTDDQ